MWVTTLSTPRAGSKATVCLGHARWDVENKGFNEYVTFWYADHVYKHEPQAILVFWLLCLTACNIFHAFFTRNLKPALRTKSARLVLSELLAELATPPNRPP